MVENVAARRPAPISIPGFRASVALELAPPAARFILRGDASVARCTGEIFGAVVPTSPRGATQAGTRAAMWLGPDEWLLLADAEDPAAVVSSLASALRDTAHSLVDVSHRQIGVIVKGDRAERLLSAGCPLDLSQKAFPVASATRTVFAKTELVLWRQSEHAFRIEIWRSFAEYLVAALSEAARGLPGF